MKIDQIPINNPCCESWDEMDGDAVRRHCARCDKDVVNLSMLTEREARTMLAECPPCVRYRFDEAGAVVFAHPQVRRQRRGLERLLGAAALVAPLLLAGVVGCSDEPPPVLGGTERAVAVEPSTKWTSAPATAEETRPHKASPGGARPPSVRQDGELDSAARSKGPSKHDPPLTEGEKKLIEVLGDRGTWTQGEPAQDPEQNTGKRTTGSLSFQEGVDGRVLSPSEPVIQGRVSNGHEYMFDTVRWPDVTMSRGKE